jgi:hypothetical protein
LAAVNPDRLDAPEEEGDVEEDDNPDDNGKEANCLDVGSS